MNFELPSVESKARIDTGAALDPARLNELRSIADPKARADAVAKQLESVFMGILLKTMRATVPDGGVLGRGLGGRTYVELLDQQWAELGGMPRDPRFHDSLVRQIMASPDAAVRAVQGADADDAAPTGENPPTSPLVETAPISNLKSRI